MNFIYSPELLAYMEKKKQRNISVEVASASHSDLEVTEIYFRLVTDSFADYLVNKRSYRSRETEVGRVLLPPYRLVYDETVEFGIKKYWIFHKFVFSGIHL